MFAFGSSHDVCFSCVLYLLLSQECWDLCQACWAMSQPSLLVLRIDESGYGGVALGVKSQGFVGKVKLGLHGLGIFLIRGPSPSPSPPVLVFKQPLYSTNIQSGHKVSPNSHLAVSSLRVCRLQPLLLPFSSPSGSDPRPRPPVPTRPSPDSTSRSPVLFPYPISNLIPSSTPRLVPPCYRQTAISHKGNLLKSTKRGRSS